MPEKVALKTNDELKSAAGKFFSQGKTARGLIERRWLRSNDLYDSIHPTGVKKESDILQGQWRIFIGKTYNTVQRMLAEVLETWFFDDEEIVGVKSGMDVSLENRQAIKALMNYRITGHPINLYSEALEATLDAIKNKVGIWKVYPRFKLEKKSKGTVGTETELLEEEGEEVVTAFSPRIECVPPEDLIIDSAATWKDYYQFDMMHRFVRTRDYLKRNGFKNVDAAPGVTDLTLSDEQKMQRAKSGNMSPFYQTLGAGQGDRVVVYEWWTHLDLDGKGIDSAVVYLLGGGNGPEVVGKEAQKNTLPLRFDDLDPVRPPFVVGSSYPEAHKLYGKDLPEFTEGTQIEYNATVNQDREAAAIAIRKPLLVNRDAGLDMVGLVNRKIGGVVTGEDIGPDAVRELSQSSPIINTDAVYRRNMNDYYEATSLYPGQFGASTKDESATGVTTTNANANKKLNLLIRNLTETLFKPGMTYLLRYEQAYETDDFIKMVTGRTLGWRGTNDGFPDWRVIQGDMEISIEMGMNKQQQLNRYLLLMDRGSQANTAMVQAIQLGIVDPAQVKLFNPMFPMDEMLKILKHKNTDEAKLQALPPKPPADGGGAKGAPPAAKLGTSPSEEVSQFNPEGFLETL